METIADAATPEQGEGSFSVHKIGPFRFPDQLWMTAAGDPRLRGQEAAKDALGVIVHHAAVKGFCYLSDARIADLMGRDVKTVKRAVGTLEALGYLSCQRGSCRGRATIYILPLDRDSEAPQRGAPMPPFDALKGGAGDHLSNGKGGRPDPERGAPVTRKGGAGDPKGGRSYAPPTSLTEVEPRSNRDGGILDSRSRSDESGGDPDECGEPAGSWAEYFADDSKAAPDRSGLAPAIHPDATIPDLIVRAWDVGDGGEVIRRICERLGVDPERKGGAIGQHIWPLTKGGSGPPKERLLRAARWAEKAIDPDMVADKPPLDGFLLIASGSEGSSDVPWPVARDSEAHASHERKGKPYRPPGQPSGAARVVADDILSRFPSRETKSQSEQLRQLDQVAARARRPEWKPRLERPRVSLSIDDLQAHADDPILAAELARRQRIPAEAVPITPAVEMMATA